MKALTSYWGQLSIWGEITFYFRQKSISCSVHKDRPARKAKDSGCNWIFAKHIKVMRPM